MQTNLITNDQTFATFLEGLNEKRLMLLASRHLPFENMFVSLVYIHDFVAEHLCSHYSDFENCSYHDSELQQVLVARYLHAMDRSEMRKVYYHCMSPCDVREDLMVLLPYERTPLIAEVWNWSVHDLNLVDSISAN